MSIFETEATLFPLLLFVALFLQKTGFPALFNVLSSKPVLNKVCMELQNDYPTTSGDSPELFTADTCLRIGGYFVKKIGMYGISIS